MKLRLVELTKYVGKDAAVLNPEDFKTLGSPSFVAVDSGIFRTVVNEGIRRDGVGLDNFSRRSIKKSLGDEVEVLWRVAPPHATEVTLAPVEFTVAVNEEFIRAVKSQLLDRTLWKEKVLIYSAFGQFIPFQVIDVKPETAVLDETTSLKILAETPRPPPIRKGFEKHLPTWSLIIEEEGLKLEEGFKYRVKVDRNYYFCNALTLEGAFCKLKPELLLSGREYYKPSSVKEVIIPSHKIEIIEDPHWLFKDL